MSIKLIEPDASHQAIATAYRNTFDDVRIPGAGGLERYDYQAWLDRNRQLKTNPPEGLVPSVQYIALDSENDMVGVLQLRLELNEYLANYGGHIGYSVHPEHRGQGYATDMLTLGLKEASQRGLTRVLMTCDTSNLASARVIEKCGGILEDSRLEPGATEPTKRYWIDCRSI